MKLPTIYPLVLLAPETDATEGASSTPTGETAESPTATDDKPSADTIGDAIAKASKELATEPSTEETEKAKADPEEETEETPEEEATPAEESEIEEEEESEEESKDKSLPFNKHPRFQELIKQGKTLRSENDTLKQEATVLKAKAATTEALHKYCEANNIAQEDLQAGLELIALSKTNPTLFRQRIGELVDTIDYASGAKLPPDLAKKVEEGIMAQEDAREIAQARVQNSQLQVQVKKSSEQVEAERQAVISRGVNTWAEAQRKSDTGFDSRYEELQEVIQASIATQGYPPTLEAAIMLVESANAKVKARYAKRTPKAPKKVLRSTGSSTINGEGLKLDNWSDLPSFVKKVAAGHR